MTDDTLGESARSANAAIRLSNVDLIFNARRIVWFVAICAATIWGLGLLRQVVVAILNVDTDPFGWNLVNLDYERSIPTLFSTLLLFCGAVTAAAVSVLAKTTEPRNAVSWALLAGIFLLLCTDETLGFHEMSGDALNTLRQWHGPLYFSWVVLGLPLVILVGVVFLPFLRRVRRATAIRLIVAGGVYVSGALGMEMIGGAVAERRGRGDFFAICFLLEEGGEMAGAVLFIRALLLHISDSTARITLNLRG